MRIISGNFKSRKIFSDSRTSKIRPTSDRARETLFNILTNKIELNDTQVLDLFSGTGSFGFETISRGADFCTFVDLTSLSRSLISKTADSFNCSDNIEFIKSDSLIYLSKVHSEFDIIFADPPYNYKYYNKLIDLVLIQTFKIFIIEHDEHFNDNDKLIVNSIIKSETKIVGNTYFTFFYK
jgi:16S rRNA (guanine966-N2)-methyltransferase